MAKKKTLTDRERILTIIIRQLQFTMMLAPNAGRGHGIEHFTGHDGTVYTHFAHYRDPKPGELVLASTGGISEWKIGFYVEPLPGDFGGAVIREIGGPLLCNYSNERFYAIVGLSEIELLEGDQYIVYQKVLAAFRRGDEYMYRFGGIKFDGDDVIIRIRERFGREDSIPFHVRLKWTRKTTVQQILDAMIAGGYGTRSFRPEATA